jgi:WD40 repeat protein
MAIADASKYSIFISYRKKTSDEEWAKWLQKAVEGYRLPRYLARGRKLRRRLKPVFRDDDELPASVDLHASIDEALAAAEFLVVVCSPNTPGSRWIDEEIRRFQELGRASRILLLLVEGEPESAFPSRLQSVYGASRSSVGQEPLAADVRPSADSGRLRKRRALTRIIAAVIGCSFDELWMRDRQRFRRRTAGLAAVAAVTLSVAAFVGFRIQSLRDASLAQTKRNESLNRTIAMKGQLALCRSLAARSLALSANQDSDPELALLYALQAVRLLPSDPAEPVMEPVAALRTALLRAPLHIFRHESESGISSVRVSPDGKWMVAVSESGSSRLWNLRTGADRIIRTEIDGASFADFDPTGKYLYLMSLDSLEIWDTSTLVRRGSLSGLASPFHVLFNDSGARMVVAGFEKGPMVYSMPDLQQPAGPIGPADSGDARFAEFQPRRRLAVWKEASKEVHVWDFDTQAAQILRNRFAVKGVEVSPDSESLVAFADGAATLWNLSDASSWDVPEPLPAKSTKVTYSPDGTVLGIYGDGPKALFLRHGQVSSVDHGRDISLVVFGPAQDRQLIATAGGGVLKLWSADTLEALAATDYQGELGEVAFSPDATRMSFSAGTGVVIWDLAAHKPVATVHPFDAIPHLQFSRNSLTLFASGMEEACVREYSSSTGVLVRSMCHEGPAEQLSLIPNGDQVVTWGLDDSTVRLWDIEQAVEPSVSLVGRGGIAVVARNNGLHLLYRSITGNLRWQSDGSSDTHFHDCVDCPAQGDSSLVSFRFSRNGRRMLTERPADNALLLIDVDSGSTLRTFEPPCPPRLGDVIAISPDGSRIAAGCLFQGTRVWDANSGEVLGDYPEATPVGVSWGIDFSPDSSKLLIRGDNGTTRLFDLSTHRQLSELKHGSYFSRVLYSDDGSRCGIATEEAGAWLLDGATGLTVKQLPHPDSVEDLLFSPQGGVLATTSKDRTLRIWSMLDGALLWQLPRTGSAAFSPDGQLLATAGESATSVWRIQRDNVGFKSELATVIPSSAATMAFSPDGQRLGTLSEGEFRVWRLDIRAAIAAACSVVSRELNPSERQAAGLTVTIASCDGLRQLERTRPPYKYRG